MYNVINGAPTNAKNMAEMKRKQFSRMNKINWQDPEYRAKHHLGEPRQRKPWFNKKYYASIMKLNDMEGMFYGEEYLGLMADIFKQMFDNKI